MGCDPVGNEPSNAARAREWAALGEWLSSPPPLRGVELEELRDGVRLVTRAWYLTFFAPDTRPT